MENNLKSTTKALLMVTHDRYFLDRCVDRIFAFDGNGNISSTRVAIVIIRLL